MTLSTTGIHTTYVKTMQQIAQAVPYLKTCMKCQSVLVSVDTAWEITISIPHYKVHYMHICTGAEDNIKDVEPSLWARALRRESEVLRPFYSRRFEAKASQILRRDFGMSRDDITSDNCKAIYIHLINTL